ncbi:restriction endonuclease subunit S [Methylobacterium sp. PvR107]|uniref:restriction endonuclease subunit S n=1 Tax=Methylobacterium sp. PvR107 TaxID=2806597 RepID=UPI001AE7659B|nr:restriction endonuclease subunit S [Methylobacterium sp. PvR107]MBP1184192.1 type I restriction enzyme S subunit [Methylobacterium sp. PvR107]
MSAAGFLEKLLDGAEVIWKPLGDVAQYSTTRIGSDQLDESNYVGVDNLLQYRAGRIDSDYIPTSGNVTEFNKGDVLIGNIRPYLRKIWQADRRGGTNGDVLVVHPIDPVLNSRYLFQVLTDEKFFEYNIQHSKGAKMPRGSKHHILQYLVPIPCPDDPEKSLSIQGEIVRILDSFTELTAKLTAELTAELKLRKKQYDHYRNWLLSFEGGEAEWKPLHEIGEFIRGKRFTKADYVDDGVGAIHYGEIYTHYGVFTHKTYSKIRSDMASSLRYAKPNDVVIAGVSETVEDVGKAVAWLGKEEVAIHDDSYAFRHNMNPKFIAYAMQTDSFHNQKAKYVSSGKIKRLLIDGVKNVRLPVPYPDDPTKSLQEQTRIVAILDTFDALTTSISEGLPREIKLREKQYAYYRDQLLSFSKPEAEAA